jgi:hypothetical protein
MEPNMGEKIAQLEAKVDKIFTSVEKTRKYFLWTIIVTLLLFILPLLALVFIIPSFLGEYMGNIDSLLE